MNDDIESYLLEFRFYPKLGRKTLGLVEITGIANLIGDSLDRPHPSPLPILGEGARDFALYSGSPLPALGEGLGVRVFNAALDDCPDFRN
jgi:hypothetical protein